MGPEKESEILSLLKEMQKQLQYLEKKIDILTRQSGGRKAPAKNYASDSRYAEQDGGAFAAFKRKGPAWSGRGKHSGTGSTYPKKNQAFKPKKKKREK